MTTMKVRHKPMSEDDASEVFLDQMNALLDGWSQRGYCNCCVARTLLLHAGLFAAHELEPDDMRRALGYIAKLSEQHAPPPGSHGN